MAEIRRVSEYPMLPKPAGHTPEQLSQHQGFLISTLTRLFGEYGFAVNRLIGRTRFGELDDRPDAGEADRFFFATDTKEMYYDDGSAWHLVVTEPEAHTHTLSDVTDSGDGAAADFATDQEVLDGQSTSTIVTPAGLAEALSQMPTALLHVQDQKPSGDNGGTFNSGAWRTRDLNTALTNEITGASLASNQITLPAGTYYIEASAPAFETRHNMSRLYDVTAASTLIWGTSEYSQDGSSDRAQTRSVISGRFTLSVESTLEIQHSARQSISNNGFGVQVGLYFTIDHETYTDARIWKIGL